MTANRGTACAIHFEALYRASRDDVYAYAQTMLRDRAAAEDVTSLAFERAYRKQRSYKPERGSARGWLFGIARNAALDELRKRKRAAESDCSTAHAGRRSVTRGRCRPGAAPRRRPPRAGHVPAATARSSRSSFTRGSTTTARPRSRRLRVQRGDAAASCYDQAAEGLPTTPPDTERELRAIEDALAGRPVEDDLLELAALTVAVRDERAVPDELFTNDLSQGGPRVSGPFGPPPLARPAGAAADPDAGAGLRCHRLPDDRGRRRGADRRRRRSG